ncbi:selenocysteine lyase [Rhynchocyon petersi]
MQQDRDRCQGLSLMTQKSVISLLDMGPLGLVGQSVSPARKGAYHPSGGVPPACCLQPQELRDLLPPVLYLSRSQKALVFQQLLRAGAPAKMWTWLQGATGAGRYSGAGGGARSPDNSVWDRGRGAHWCRGRGCERRALHLGGRAGRRPEEPRSEGIRCGATLRQKRARSRSAQAVLHPAPAPLRLPAPPTTLPPPPRPAPRLRPAQGPAPAPPRPPPFRLRPGPSAPLLPVQATRTVQLRQRPRSAPLLDPLDASEVLPPPQFALASALPPPHLLLGSPRGWRAEQFRQRGQKAGGVAMAARSELRGDSRGHREQSPPERKVYMDYNATTPLDAEVIQAMTEAMWTAWGNPSSSYAAGRKAKGIINTARRNLAKMIGGRPQDIIFTSGGTESNNLVIHSVVKHFQESQATKEDRLQHKPQSDGAKPHIITCTVEHDSIRLPLEHLEEGGVAAVTFVPVSKVSGQAEVDDILAAIRPTTCLVTIMLANNETGVVMRVPEISQRVKALNAQRVASGLPRVLVHTDAAQALGKRRVDVEDLGVDFLTIVGHKFYGPRIGALYIRGLGELTPLYPMLFGGGQERNLRPGTENTPMIAGLGKAAELVIENCEAYEAHMTEIRDYLEERLQSEFGKRLCFNSHFPGTQRLANTCNVSIRGPQLQGRLVLAQCRTLVASVGAACHSDLGDQPSPVLLSCGVPVDVASNALRLSVGRSTTRAEVDLVVEDLKRAVAQLEGLP